MKIDRHLIDDPDTWHAEYTKRVTGYQDLLDKHRAALETFELDKRAALDELRGKWLEKLKEPEEQLYQVAPIFENDVAAIPSQRTAYSDRTAALMAKIAMLSYVGFEDAEKKKILDGMLKFGKVKQFETLCIGETEALVAETDKFVVVAFRGTTSKDDMRTNLQARFNVAKTQIEGRPIEVHSGFYAAFRKVESQLRELLATSGTKPIYITGHSLGGALALVASAALGGKPEPGKPALGDRIAAVYTFGAPRVGTHKFAEIVKAPHYRIVNSGDIVPFVPPIWLRRYVHTGIPVLLKKGSDRPIFRSPKGAALAGGLMSLLLWPFTRQLIFLSRHDSSLYVANLERIARHRGKWS